MQDGYTQVGAGQNDTRVAGKDLQHFTQTKTADEWHVPVRFVRQEAQMGGPMKEYMDSQGKNSKEHLESEKRRHDESREHQNHHMEKHQKRDYNSQHGGDTYNY